MARHPPRGRPRRRPAERARFLATESGPDEAAIRRDLEGRDARLARAVASDEEIVLWFEADLFDRLQVLQIPDRVPRASLAMAGVERWQSIQEPPPPVPRPVTAEQFAAARAAWRAIGSGDPGEVEDIDGAGDAARNRVGAAR